MSTVDLTLPHHHYQIEIAPGCLQSLGEQVRTLTPHDRAAMIVDHNVADTHGKLAQQALTQAGYQLTVATMTATEEHKSLDNVRTLYDQMLSAHLERRSPIIVVGGGIVGDTAGFVAATYLRGVPFVLCPTTLLAMVDASVGGKVGVNVPQGKNLVGAFHQPMRVVVDTDTLKTLPMREIRCGLAECVKHGVIRDPRNPRDPRDPRGFHWLEENVERVLQLESDALVELIEWNVRIKADVVMADEKEAGVRAHLNFGHTFAHAIEAATGDLGTSKSTDDHYHHGEAVALGMVAATRLAVDTRRCDASVLDRLTTLLDRIGLPTQAKGLPDVESLMQLMRLDKKVADGRVRLVLPDQLGHVQIVTDTPDEAIAAAWRTLS